MTRDAVVVSSLPLVSASLSRECHCIGFIGEWDHLPCKKGYTPYRTSVVCGTAVRISARERFERAATTVYYGRSRGLSGGNEGK
jgi:hypothetical protein